MRKHTARQTEQKTARAPFRLDRVAALIEAYMKTQLAA